MLLLVAKALGTLVKYPDRNVGRLIGPRHYARIEDTVRAGFLWAADNDAYSAWNPEKYQRMLDKITNVSGCLFVTCPDVVGDAEETFKNYLRWGRRVMRTNQPVAYVLQDGCEIVPWNGIGAVFVGGTTEYKLSQDAADVVADAKARQKWVHMGRVNSKQRIEYAKAIGCDSVDGSQFSMFTDRWLSEFATLASAPQQQILK